MKKSNESRNVMDINAVTKQPDRNTENNSVGRRVLTGGRTAIWQARLVLLVMINIAQLWILSATIEAALAAHYKQLVPLIIASGVCWLIAFTIFLWWRPAGQRSRSRGTGPPQ